MLHISLLIDVGGYDAELYLITQSVPVALSCCTGVSFVKVSRHVVLLTTYPLCLVLTDEKKRVYSGPALVRAYHPWWALGTLVGTVMYRCLKNCPHLAGICPGASC